MNNSILIPRSESHNIVIQYFRTFQNDCQEKSSSLLSRYKDIT